MNEVKLGQLVEGEASRDVVHVAVLPVVAHLFLRPGEQIGFVQGSRERVTNAPAGKFIGIVDPFLKRGVLAEERFYMCLLPGSVVSLRHHWHSPDVPDEPGVELPARAKAEQWLREFADGNGMLYESLMGAVPSWRSWVGEDVCGERIDGVEGFYIPPEFWDNYEAVTGIRHQFRTARQFTCNCVV